MASISLKVVGLEAPQLSSRSAAHVLADSDDVKEILDFGLALAGQGNEFSLVIPKLLDQDPKRSCHISVERRQVYRLHRWGHFQPIGSRRQAYPGHAL